MKKFYSFLLVALLSAATAVAASHRLQATGCKPIVNISSNTISTARATLPMLATSLQTRVQAPVIPAGAPTTGWQAMTGKGTFYDGLLDCFGDLPAGPSWEVDIEENTATPGWYRLIPYIAGSQEATILGQADNTYLYVNATDPTKVYCESATFFGSLKVTQLVDENDWEGYDAYGTLTAGVITFPEQSFVYNDQTYTNRDGKCKIALPGAVVKDYDLSISTPFCTDDNAFALSITRGADVTDVKLVVTSGLFTSAKGNESYINQNGQSFSVNTVNYDGSSDPIGAYSALAIGLDGDSIVASSACYFFVSGDEEGSWTSLGQAKYNEGVYLPSYNNTYDPVELTCEVQEETATPGRYRLVDPYASMAGVDSVYTHQHHHYLYINATDTANVYVEPSCLGIDYYGYGLGAVWSFAAEYLDAGYDVATIKSSLSFDVFGKKTEDGIITMPDNSLLIGEQTYEHGKMLQTGKDFRVELPDPTAIRSISDDSDAEAPAEYYDLTGRRIDASQAHGIVILKQGAKAHKVVR